MADYYSIYVVDLLTIGEAMSQRSSLRGPVLYYKTKEIPRSIHMST